MKKEFRKFVSSVGKRTSKAVFATFFCALAMTFPSEAKTAWYVGGEPGVTYGTQVESVIFGVGAAYLPNGTNFHDDSEKLKDQWVCIVDGSNTGSDEISWYYYNRLGDIYKGMKEINGKTYCFSRDGSGRAVYGWVQEGIGEWYYFQEKTGIMQTSGTYERDGLMYNIGGDGKATFASQYSGNDGWKQEDKKWCFYRNGEKVYGEWVDDGGVWYYVDTDGYMIHSQTAEIGGQIYSFADNGRMETNVEKFHKGLNYAFGADGVGVRKENPKDNPYEANEVVQWFNTTYLLLTKSNIGDEKFIGGMRKNSWLVTEGELAWTLLTEWGITDRDSGEQVVQSLLSSAQSAEHFVKAWDYSRAMQLTAWFYLADYYTVEESLDKQLEIAKQIQNEFSSWEDFNLSYMTGFRNWCTDESRLNSRERIYRDTSRYPQSPFHTIDWNLKLEKNW